MKSTSVKLSLAIAALLACGAVQSANIDKSAYNDGKARIAADYKANKMACDSLAGNKKDICVEEAKGKEKIAMAELEYSHTGKPADEAKIAKVKADTEYAVAKEKCDDLAGNTKDVCQKEAKAAQTKALADAKTSKKVGEARMDGAQEKRDADYKVAAEKCDALAGDAKASCISAAKARFGKS